MHNGIGLAVEDLRGRINAVWCSEILEILRKQGKQELPVALRRVEVREVDRIGQTRELLLEFRYGELVPYREDVDQM